jgi:hypothetical protein
MRRHLIAWLACWFLLGCSSPAQEKVPTARVVQEMSRLLSWRWFWDGEASPKPYTPGKGVQMAIVESPNEVAVFIAEIGVAAYFQLNDDKIVRESIQSIPDASNAAAVSRYISRYGVTPGFAFKEGKAPSSPDVPVRRENLTEEQKRKILKQYSVSFTLPTLGPPKYITSRRAPPDLASFESTVRARVDDFYSTSCGSGEILIPYFSPTDPVVYVYADLGTCGQGIIGFVNDGKGQWTSGQFSPAKPPNQWSTTIKRIRDNTAAAIRLPARVQ